MPAQYVKPYVKTNKSDYIDAEVLQQSAKQSSGLSAWLAQLKTRVHSNVAAVALANKLARMAWAVLAKNEPYRPPVVVGAATA